MTTFDFQKNVLKALETLKDSIEELIVSTTTTTSESE